MQLTRAADYAARVMIHLASLPAGARASRSSLARSGEVPEQFLAKILQTLVRSGLVASQRGSSGGFSLRRLPAEITLLDVIAAIEGPLFLNRCVNPVEGCHRHTWCGAHELWVKAQAAMVDVLGKRTILDLARESAERQAGDASSRCVLDTLDRRIRHEKIAAWT
jgi:Rrf2 family protein